MARPTILFITAPLPGRQGTGAEIRAFFLLQAASLIGDVSLVCLQTPTADQRAELERLSTRVIFPGPLTPVRRKTQSRFLSWGRSIAAVLLPWQQRMIPYLCLCSQFTLGRISARRGRVLGWILLLHQWLLSRPLSIPPAAVIWKEHSISAVVDEVKRVIVSQHLLVDLVWLETTLAFACFERLADCISFKTPVVLSAHNIEWMIPKRQASDIRDPLLRLATLLQADLMRQFERRAHRTSDLAIHCSSTDAELAKTFAAKTRIVCIGNGVDIEHYKSSPNNVSDAPLIIYTGNFNYQPNIDAAIRLIVDVLPLIRRDVPDVQLLIAGRNAAALADKLPVGLSWLTIVPNPDDMRPLLEQAWITVIPLRSGSGTRLKILEAMAMKVAVISTAIGAEGLEATDGDVLLIRDSAKAQAEAAVRLLQNAQARGELADRACKWVGERFSWDRLVQQTVDEVRPLVTRH